MPFSSLTIITITYRDPRGLARTLNSLQVLRELDLDFEHIVVDSSPEQNESVYKNLVLGWPLVRVPVEPKGIYAAINAGLAIAKKNAVWILNGGDECADTKVLLEMLRCLVAYPELAMVFAGANLFKESKFDYSVRAANSILDSVQGTNKQCHQSILYKRNSLLALAPFNEKYTLAADYDLHWRAYILGYKSKSLVGNLVNYDKSGASSNVWRAMLQFRAVQRNLSAQLSWRINFLHIIFWYSECVKLFGIKSLAKIGVLPAVKKLWLYWRNS